MLHQPMELAHPTLSWKQETPVAEAFEDGYYMTGEGLAESRHVFIEGNRLPERLQNVEPPLLSRPFIIAETGFGTGLNLLALWDFWRSLPEPRQTLHIISVEQHPVAPGDMQRAHAAWPELAELSQQLIALLPPPISGAHRRWLEDGQITIDLLYGDAVEMLNHYQLVGTDSIVDVWFLDGFAPDRNPQMWCPELYQAMARLSTSGTSFATFTAAGAVRRGLAEVGFEVRKEKGYGRKRDMSVGLFQPANDTLPSAPSLHTPHTNHTLIIGAGIAGTSMAWHLAQLGREVTIVDAADSIASGASGNPASAFTPFYPVTWNQRGRLLASAFHTSHELITLLRRKGHAIGGRFNGVLMLDEADGTQRSQRLRKWQQSLTLPETIRQTLSAEAASERVGITLPHGGWFYPHGGWVHMPSLCRALLADAGANIHFHPSTSVTHIEHRSGQWVAHLASREPLTAPHVVIATAHAASTLLPELSLEAVHGQLLQFDAPPGYESLQCVIHAGHMLIPSGDRKLSWGASFRHHLSEPDILEEETAKLLNDLQTHFPDIDVQTLQPTLTAWAGLRCTHHSRLPLIGRAPNQPDGLWLHLAHGARGLLGGPLPFDSAIYQAL